MLRARRSISALWIPVKRDHPCVPPQLAACASNGEVVEATRAPRKGRITKQLASHKIEAIILTSNALQFSSAAKIPADSHIARVSHNCDISNINT
jgi:hypothetical protein